MVDVLNHVPDMRYPKDRDLRRVIPRVRDQFVHTQVNATNAYVENHSPKGLQLVSLQPGDEVMLSELLAHDRA